jgi:hypothetical protein
MSGSTLYDDEILLRAGQQAAAIHRLRETARAAEQSGLALGNVAMSGSSV